MRIVKDISVSFLDYPDKENLAAVVYFTGCEHSCAGCHSESLKNHFYGEEISVEDLYSLLLNKCNETRNNKIVFLGGDPLYPENIEGVKEFLEKFGMEFGVMIYTGYDIEKVRRECIRNFDYIKCGEYLEGKKMMSQKSDTRMVFASSNQVLYDGNLNEISVEGVFEFNKIGDR